MRKQDKTNTPAGEWPGYFCFLGAGGRLREVCPHPPLRRHLPPRGKA